MKRRNLLAAAALAPFVEGRAHTALAGKTAIVVGTAAAGAVAVSRLAQAGIHTVVLEHGRPDAHERFEQPRRSEWDMVYPPGLYDEMNWSRARSMTRRPEAVGTVTEIRDASGRFAVRTTRETLTADFLFLAAGTVATTSLLVTAKARGWLPRLRDEVGKGFGTNGAFAVAWLNARKETARVVDDANKFAPAAITGEAVPVPTWMKNSTAHLIVSVTPERGEIRYDAASGTGKVYWPYGPMETAGEKAGRDLATRLWWQAEGKQGNLLRGVPSYDRAAGLGASHTWHPLGGMVMGQSTDHSGQSLDYPNLYCLDGSVLPGSTCLANPALTVAANAERIMDHFLAVP